MTLLPEFLKNGLLLKSVSPTHSKQTLQIYLCELGLRHTVNSHHWWLTSALNDQSYDNKLVTFRSYAKKII